MPGVPASVIGVSAPRVLLPFVHSYKLYEFYMDFIWILYGYYGFIWIYMDLYGFIWIYMDLYGFIWIYSINIYIYIYIYTNRKIEKSKNQKSENRKIEKIEKSENRKILETYVNICIYLCKNM